MTTTDFAGGQVKSGAHLVAAPGEPNLPVGQPAAETHSHCADGDTTSASPDHSPSDSMPTLCASGLADPLLALLAESLDDLEHTRIANENRLRQLTRNEADKDGINRGFGLDVGVGMVKVQAAIVADLTELEHRAELNLKRRLRQHPLGSWVKATIGVGEKQAARLLASLGDPYWNTLYDRPRTVSELWAYCGLHVLPASQARHRTHESTAGGSNVEGGDTDQPVPDAHDLRVGVAPSRSRGVKSNWNATAKMRAFLIAESCVKQATSPYRAVYDEGRAKYDEATHQAPCRRCGPAGRPAQPGSPLSKGHQHARALRLVMKTILRDLWVTARDIHGETS